MSPIVVIGLTAFALSYLGVAALRGWAKEGGAVLNPTGEAHIQNRRLSAVELVIVFVTLLGLTLSAFFGLSAIDYEWRFYIVGALVIATVGWIDDLHPLPSGLRILSQILGAVVIILFFGFIEQVTLPIINEILLGWLGLPITILLTVGLINAYNFMDGIDGLAGTQATLGGFAWMVIGVTLLPSATELVGVLLELPHWAFLFTIGHRHAYLWVMSAVHFLVLHLQC